MCVPQYPAQLQFNSITLSHVGFKSVLRLHTVFRWKLKTDLSSYIFMFYIFTNLFVIFTVFEFSFGGAIFFIIIVESIQPVNKN